MSGAVHVGTSGWNYKHWVGPFYPKDLPQRKMLAYYADHFDTVEVNNTFYQLPQFSTFTTWRETVPHDFTFALKASRFITHMKKLKVPKTSTQKFYNRSGRLEDKLGPVLFQLPPGWQRNCDRLAEFLDAIPSDGQNAFEFRNQSWLQSEVYDLLRQHNVAFCIHDFGGKEIATRNHLRWSYSVEQAQHTIFRLTYLNPPCTKGRPAKRHRFDGCYDAVQTVVNRYSLDQRKFRDTGVILMNN